jgi:hypothetical protein
MIVHQAIGMADPVEQSVYAMERLKKDKSVRVLTEDWFPFISPRRVVIERPIKFYSQRSRHTPRLSEVSSQFKNQDLTPMLFIGRIA